MKKEKSSLRYITMFAVVLTTAALACAGCGKGETPEGETPAPAEAVDDTLETESGEETAAETQEPQEEFSVEVSEETEEQFKNDDGELLLTSTVNSVSVRIPDNQEAEDAVCTFFSDLSSAYDDTIEEYLGMAQEELSWRKEEGLTEGWNGYGLGRAYSVARADEKMICIVETSYEYTGGAHPNSARVAYNFDTGSGARLALADITDDPDGLLAECAEYLREMLPESEYADMLFDDYANHLEDILTDATWYTDENGFHIICNEYIITPHAAGILDFVLLYEDVAVAGRYLPEQTAAADAPSDQETEDDAAGNVTTEDDAADDVITEDGTAAM